MPASHTAGPTASATRFNVDRQIAASPDAVASILADTRSVPLLDADRPIIFAGIGTSLHAARVAADWVAGLSGGAVRAQALDAHDVGTWTPLRTDDQVVVISHRGTKVYPTASLRRAREAGAATIAIVGHDSPEQEADHVFRTCGDETAGTFTVSYLASMAALGRLVAATFDGDGRFTAALEELPTAIERTLSMGDPVTVAADLADAHTLLVIGFGRDLPTAQEAALKIKEGAWMWTEAMSPEFALHGTPASYTPELAAVLIEAEAGVDGGRTALLRSVLADLGVRSTTVSEDPKAPLAFTSPHPLLRPVTGIVPLQRLTAELARVRETDPDTMHGHREPWQTVMTGIRL